MTREDAEDAAARLARAEVALRHAQLERDGTLRAVERYRAARSELTIAESIAAALVSGLR